MLDCQRSAVADLGEGPGGPRAPLILSEKRRNDLRKKSQQASKTKLGPPLSSKSGSASDQRA